MSAKTCVNPLHAKVRHNLDRRVGNHLKQTSQGIVLCAVDCQLTEDRGPDVAIFVGEKRRNLDPGVSPIPFAPAIAVEVLAPEDPITDLHRKTLQYLQAGSREVWQFDGVNGQIFGQTDAGIRLLRVEDRLAGFSFPASELLAGF